MYLLLQYMFLQPYRLLLSLAGLATENMFLQSYSPSGWIHIFGSKMTVIKIEYPVLVIIFLMH